MLASLSLSSTRGRCWLQTAMKMREVGDRSSHFKKDMAANRASAPCVFSIHWGKLDNRVGPIFSLPSVMLYCY